jgi:hypothetical protein
LPHLRDFVRQNDPITVISLIDTLIQIGAISADRHIFPDINPVRKNAA